MSGTCTRTAGKQGFRGQVWKVGQAVDGKRTLTGERLTMGHLTMLPYCFSNPANSNSSSPYGTSVDDLFISSRKSYVAEGVRQPVSARQTCRQATSRCEPTERPTELLCSLNVDDVVLAGTVFLQVGGEHDVGRVESCVHELRVRCKVARVAILVERRDPATVWYKGSARKGVFTRSEGQRRAHIGRGTTVDLNGSLAMPCGVTPGS